MQHALYALYALAFFAALAAAGGCSGGDAVPADGDVTGSGDGVASGSGSGGSPDDAFGAVDGGGDGAGPSDVAADACSGADCGVCLPARGCASLRCAEGDLWCFDDCGNPDHVQQSCEGRGCVDGACVGGGAVETACGDGVDDDEDGATDCDDSDCSADPACNGSCTPSLECARVACHQGDAWCFDDCDVPDHRVASCGGAGCAQGLCADDFATVPKGTFTMGSPADEPGHDPDEEPLHSVELTHDFALQRTEVTQWQWLALMGNMPSSHGGCLDCPVEGVSWYAALRFANARSEAEGLPPCYQLTGCSGEPGLGLYCDQVEVNAPGGNPYLCKGYRLPTEAEWEYEYRAGTTTAFYAGAPQGADCDEPTLDPLGWYCGNAEGATHPVGQKTPNAWDLYDMAGNVWEWCWDVYDSAYYESSPAKDPSGPSTGAFRVMRGGAWDREARFARAAARGSSSPDLRFDEVGFRLARTLLP